MCAWEGSPLPSRRFPAPCLFSPDLLFTLLLTLFPRLAVGFGWAPFILFFLSERVASVVDIRPFRAVRHTQVSPNEMGEVTSPPYDVFTPELQRAFHDRHPHNVVRLIQGETLQGEADDEGRIGRAAGFITEWIKDGVLAADPAPAVYPYLQSFTLPGGKRLERRTFFTAVRLEKYGEGKIYPHEQTFPKPKGFLFGLYGKCGAHFGPIFSFYSDPEDTAFSALSASMNGDPIADFEDDGVHHTLWRCDDPVAIEAVQKALADKEGFIADGHHRYETSLNLQEAAGKAARPRAGKPTTRSCASRTPPIPAWWRFPPTGF